MVFFSDLKTIFQSHRSYFTIGFIIIHVQNLWSATSFSIILFLFTILPSNAYLQLSEQFYAGKHTFILIHISLITTQGIFPINETSLCRTNNQASLPVESLRCHCFDPSHPSPPVWELNCIQCPVHDDLSSKT